METKIFNELNNIIKRENWGEINFSVTKPTSLEFGEFTSNIALVGAKFVKKNPRDFANEIVQKIDKQILNIKEIQIVGPGFINFFLDKKYYGEIVENILKQGEDFGKGKKTNDNINLEFVSANPTGFLHVAHARGAALGDSLANILEFSGTKVTREYYINDAGNQIDCLGVSVYARYQQLFGKDIELPEDSYVGSDIIWGAEQVKNIIGDEWVNKEYKDIKDEVKKLSTKIMLDKIKIDLEKMGVTFDIWFSEKSLYDEGLIDKHLTTLKGTYKKDGAIWLETTKFGDDKDRVLLKSNGEGTYFLPDTIYHTIKATREKNISKLINIWGADHSGYIKRMEVALELQGFKNILEVITLQLVKLIKDGKEVKMSKRKGTSLFLSELVEQVGKDTTRFFLVNRSVNSQIDFDLDLANLKTNDNPVFIVQYAHARTIQLLNKSEIKLFDSFNYVNDSEFSLINLMNKFPELIQQIAQNSKVNLMTQYLIDLAREYNSFYSNIKIIGNEREKDLLALSKACGNIIKIGLKLLGVSAPERM